MLAGDRVFLLSRVKYSVTWSREVGYFPGVIALEGIAACLRSRGLCG